MNAHKQPKAETVGEVLDEMDRQRPHVYRAIAEVQGELAKVGIAKNRKNSQPGASYNFRGIDDVYAALSPLLAQHNLVVIPRVIHRECVERTSSKGNALFYVTVHAEFDFVSALDGSRHTAATFGEAMDSSDKATNKAMSAAYKYAAFMTFAIPTQGEDNDADASHHEVAAAPQRPALISSDDFERIKELAPKAGKSLADLEAAYKVDGLLNLTEVQGRSCIARLEALAKEPA